MRPWKAPSQATQPPPGRSRRDSFSAASFASAPELVNSTRLSGPAPTSALSRSASSMPGAWAARLLVWPSVLICRVTASTTAGWAWPSRLTAMPPSRSTYCVPSTSQTVAPLPLREHDRRGAVVAHERVVPARLPARCGAHAGTTIVPMPSSVNSSSSRLWATPAVEDVGARHAPAHGGQARLHLGDHAARQARQQGRQVVGADLADDVLGRGPVGVQPLDVGEHDELLGADRDGEGCRGGVGVDVVELAVGAAGDGGDDRHLAVVEQRPHDRRPHLDDLADQSDVDRLHRRRPRRAARR